MGQSRNQLSIRQIIRCTCCVTFLLALKNETASAWQAVPGRYGEHPLNQAEAGELLIEELRCAACHGGIDPKSVLAKSAPDLSEAGARISPDYLQRFLASPTSVHPAGAEPGPTA